MGRSMHRPRLAVAAGLLVLALGAAVAAPRPALGDAADDYRAVFADWRADQDVAPCRFTRTQLSNAAAVAGSIQDFDGYAPGFRDEVRREIARHDSGGCAGIAAPSADRARSPLRRVRITRIRPGGGSSESVTIRNTGSRSVSLRGATLRDRRGNRLRFPRSTRLRGKRSLRVVTGCTAGMRRAGRRGSRLYACRRGRLWDDRGDVVKLVDSRRRVVSQRGYGTLRRVPRF